MITFPLFYSPSYYAAALRAIVPLMGTSAWEDCDEEIYPARRYVENHLASFLRDGGLAPTQDEIDLDQTFHFHSWMTPGHPDYVAPEEGPVV